MPLHRQRHPQELEARFRKPIKPRVAHSLPVEQQALSKRWPGLGVTCLLRLFDGRLKPPP